MDGTTDMPTVCQVLVTFSPTAPWTSGSRYRVASLNYGSNAIAGLIGQAQQPALLKLSATSASGVTVVTNGAASSVDFGQILSGATPSITFTITNVGESATAGAVQASLTSATYVSASAPCGALTAAGTAGDHCTATVTVLNGIAVGGTYTSGSVQATDPSMTDGSEDSAEKFSLSVRVVHPAVLKLSGPTSLSFGSTPVGIPSATTISLEIRNGDSGNSSVDLQDTGSVSIALSDSTNFKLDYGTCAGFQGLDGTFKLNSTTTAESCTVSVTFNPKSVGALQTNVTVSSATGTPGGAAQLTLTGTGQGDLVVTSSNATNGGRIVVTDTVDLIYTNNGSGSTNLLRTTLAGTNAAAFAVVFDSCYGQQLDAGASCKVTVVFTGTASATTAQTADVTVSDGSATTTNNTATALLKVGGPST